MIANPLVSNIIYEPVLSKICVGIRKSKYLLDPLENKEFVSIDKKPLNPCLTDLFMKGVNSRDSDIRNILRKNDIKLGYNSTNKIQILQSDIGKTKDLETIEKELKNEIKIMISLIDDAEEQLHWKQIYDDKNIEGKQFLESLLQDLTNRNILCSEV